MIANRTYRRHCTQCNEETIHVPARSLSVRVAIRTWKIFIFFISLGLVYPHPLPSDDDPVEVACTTCLTRCTIHG
jgi:hypothetical protein